MSKKEFKMQSIHDSQASGRPGNLDEHQEQELERFRKEVSSENPG